MSADIAVTLTYSEREAREVVRAIRYFDSNVTASYEDHDRMALIATAVQLALPQPKPAEPTGLGAVVEDAAGGRWLRVAAPDLGGGVWIGEVFNGCGDPQSTQYDNVPAVRVLSEGVTP